MGNPMRLLLLSNSKNYGHGYLEHAEGYIKDFLGRAVETVLFVPFAAVRVSYDEFAATVGRRFGELGYGLESVHRQSDAGAAVARAQAVVVGGGNTWHLLKKLYDSGLIEAIRARARGGVPYVGWSAGANVAGLSIRTTNDMPIVQPPSFEAFGLVPFQLNPHYNRRAYPQPRGRNESGTDPGVHHREPGSAGRRAPGGEHAARGGHHARASGREDARVFVSGREPSEYEPGLSLQFLMP